MTARVHVLSVPGGQPGPPGVLLVDPAGARIPAPELAEVWPFDPDGEGGSVAAARAAGSGWGYLDHTGRWRVAPVLDEAKRLAWPGGLARFRQGDAWGYVNARGEVVIGPRYREASAFSHGLAAVRTGRKFHYIDASGDVVVEGPFKPAGPFSALGLAAVRTGADRPAGYVDVEGRMAVEPRFDDALLFGAQGAAPVRVGDRWGLIDTAGGWIVEPRHARIDEFGEDGLAYRIEAGRPSDGYGYLDASGRTVVRGGAGLSPVMACGLVRDDDADLRFLDRAGRPAFVGRFDWAEDFDPSCGACVARRGGRWGVLDATGRFRAVPFREPMTTAGGVVGFGPGQGVAPFLDGEGTVVFVNRAAEVVARLGAGGPGPAARGGLPVRPDSPGTAAPRPLPAVLRPGPDEHFLVPEAQNGGVVGVATGLLAAEPVRFYPYSLVFGGRRSVADVSGLGGDGAEHLHTGSMLVLAESHVGEELWGTYRFLADQEGGAFAAYFADLAAQLAGHFGEPECDTVRLRNGDGNTGRVWYVNGRRLVLEVYTHCGDGDFEHQLWLAALV
ncbi:WG repeat-containing protein [Streptomyces erythrochromogenes]|uniref:WG repeat-containing protein n=1 Tax=Streptomyces erythrochromogenes TaxID=285574 RepID=UPI00380E21BD